MASHGLGLGLGLGSGGGSAKLRSCGTSGDVKVVGTILNTALITKNADYSTVLAGYTTAPAVYSEEGMSFNVSNLLTGEQLLRAEAKTPRPHRTRCAVSS
jgi:hypothetical protein